MKKMNQTYFTGSPVPKLVLVTASPELKQAPRPAKKRPKRRLNAETQQTLITSSFSPRAGVSSSSSSSKVLGLAVDDEGGASTNKESTEDDGHQPS